MLNRAERWDKFQNMRILTSAAWGAATKKAIFQSPIETYLAKIQKESPVHSNPEEATIATAMTQRVTQAIEKNHYSRDDLLTVPWSARRIKPARLAASLIAFSNDQGQKPIPEFLPVDEIFLYLN